MNQKELNELRRRFRPERSGITHVYGCFVNGSREVVAETEVSLGMSGKEEQEMYLGLLKKTLSGTLGRNLITSNSPPRRSRTATSTVCSKPCARRSARMRTPAKRSAAKLLNL